ncbi:hypothetical protein B0H14DRAFT_3508884 [Mycena olivaceomarginata]|nr:hypothetical protein B0H14DRAFT_3508884 [Mycena olivaceomarginata]
MRVLYFFIGICVGLPALAAPVAQPEVVPVETPVKSGNGSIVPYGKRQTPAEDPV